MICPQCRREYKSTAKFCRDCGVALQDLAARADVMPNSAPTLDADVANIRSDNPPRPPAETIEVFLDSTGKFRPFSILLFSVLFASFIIGFLVTILNSRDSSLRYLLPVVFLIGLFLVFIVSAALIAALQKAVAHKDIISPMVPGISRGFLLCEEGIYTREFQSIFAGNRFYRLHAWELLSLYRIDEKKRLIALKDGNKLFKLKAAVNFRTNLNYFNEVKDFILSRMPERRRCVPGDRDRFTWMVFAAAVFLVILVYSFGNSYINGISEGVVGDELCDISVASPWHDFAGKHNMHPRVFGVYTDDALIHEYCFLHGPALAVIHPLITIKSTRKTILSNKEKKGAGPARLDSMGFIVLTVISLFVWIVVLSILYALTPWRKWYRTPVLKQ